jgi:2-hydroxychromene-2-carboxylate isomerase
MTPDTPRFYFSFRSPYSWIAARRIESDFPHDRIRLEYLPYWERQLYILQDVKRIWTRLGYRGVWPRDGEKPCWELPHMAYLYACRRGRGREFFWAVWRARWEEGRNITEEATVAAIAGEVGLDPMEPCQARHDPLIREEGIDALWRAGRDGVFGVPFFILRHERFWGQDRIDEFLEALHRQLGEVASCRS